MFISGGESGSPKEASQGRPQGGPVTYLDGVMVMGPPDREGMLYLYG